MPSMWPTSASDWMQELQSSRLINEEPGWGNSPKSDGEFSDFLPVSEEHPNHIVEERMTIILEENQTLRHRMTQIEMAHERTDQPCEGAVPKAVNGNELTTLDNHDDVFSTQHDDGLDYLFQMPEGTSTGTFKNQVQRMVKQFRMELENTIKMSKVSHRAVSRLDFLEVMCGDQSELTRQTIQLGGKARRFTLHDGDLSTQLGRQKLFQVMISHRPRHLWYSPVCKPWCMWSQFNATKSLIQNETIFQERMNHLWQISLTQVPRTFLRRTGLAAQNS